MTAAETRNSQPEHRAFSFARMWAIGRNTLTELIRLKIFYFILIFALIVIGNSAFMVKFSFQEEFQMLKDVSLGAMSIFSSILAIAAAAMLIPKDIEERTLYTILAKPVPRTEYLLGKLTGMIVLLAIAIVVMAAVFLAVLAVRQEIAISQIQSTHEQAHGGEAAPLSAEAAKEAVEEIRRSARDWAVLPGIFMIFLKAAILAALTLFISTFATSGLFTIIVTVAIYFIGHLQSVAREYWLSGEAASWMTKAVLALVSLLFPDLQMFNLVDDIVAGNEIPAALFLRTTGLGLLYVGVYAAAALIVFSGKEL